MQKISHNIQNPRFLKLFELWAEHRRIEDRGEEKCMQKEKTELKEDTAYTCAILVLEFAANKSFDTCKKGGPSFLTSNLFHHQQTFSLIYYTKLKLLNFLFVTERFKSEIFQ